MIDILKQQLSKDMSDEEKANRVREGLQLLILKILNDKGWFGNLVFVGGTALRIIYRTRRFSEDLDFSLTESKGYDFHKMVDQLKREIELNGLKVEAKPQTEKTVNSVMLKFSELLKPLGLSPLKDQKLVIKLEIDTNPPEGGDIQSTLINNIYLFNVRHYDLSSLYAGKISACFYRKYLKGRDFYDLIWYLGKRIHPNYELLNNAIEQNLGKSPGLKADNIREFLLEKVSRIDLKQAARDVDRFLEDKSELKLFDQETIKNSIHSVFG